MFCNHFFFIYNKRVDILKGSEMNLNEIKKAETNLIEAMKINDVNGVVAELEKGLSPNFEYAGMPVILYAAQREMWDIVEELYMAEADMTAKNEMSGWTLLHQLTACGKIEQIKAYLDFIDKRYAADKIKGQSAFMIAVESNQREVFDYFVSKGFEFREKDFEQNNVFHYVAKAGWVDVLQEHGIKHPSLIEAKNKNGETPLFLAGLSLADLKIENQEDIKETIENKDSVQEKVEVQESKPKIGKLKGAKRL